MLIGKPEGKPKYNCPFCDGCAPFLEPSDLYTFEDLFTWHQVIFTLSTPSHLCNILQSYVDAGCPSKRQKDFQNFVNSPLVTGPRDSFVLDKLNIPGLHIILGTESNIFFIFYTCFDTGVVDKLISSFEENVFEKDGLEWMNEYLKQVG